MLVTRFDPFKDFMNMPSLMTYNNTKNSDTSISAFAPSVNTREGEFAYHIDIDLPGMKKKDINIDIKDRRLTIWGERNFKEEVKEEDYYKVESSFGKFQRVFTLPDNVDIENISASSENGVLEIVLPKIKEDDKKRKIQIK
ncbi:Hsp20/alpha crystallin family protein [Arcobacter sp. YIC-464]|uniref:Hsp20/alpha crystallin family protein n=1 Tax=Arcobacter sp. YIC-464 TaxID=3376631 RepID=UPI003C1DDFCD